jgi:hypothetical protein
MNNFFDVSKMSAGDAQYEAQKIAFAPIIFQVARVLRTSGILKLLDTNRAGLSIDEVAHELSMTSYVVSVLLETGLSAGIVAKKDELFTSTKIGYFLLNDEMTKVNMDFNHFVNYLGLYELENAVKSGKPSGLKVFNNDDTIYPGLAKLPEEAKKAWFDFDHFYSDSAFKEAIEIMSKYDIKKLLDIGGNTGKFSRLCAASIPSCHVTIVDLPGQLDVAKSENEKVGLSNQIDTYTANMLDDTTRLPKEYDAAWMSQFLDCFGEDDIVRILTKVAQGIENEGHVFILEPLWDRQRYAASAYCIINTSPYFTAMANGTSKMFNFGEISKCISKAGLYVDNIYDNIGFSHSLIVCKKIKGDS